MTSAPLNVVHDAHERIAVRLLHARQMVHQHGSIVASREQPLSTSCGTRFLKVYSSHGRRVRALFDPIDRSAAARNRDTTKTKKTHQCLKRMRQRSSIEHVNVARVGAERERVRVLRAREREGRVARKVRCRRVRRRSRVPQLQGADRRHRRHQSLFVRDPRNRLDAAFDGCVR